MEEWPTNEYVELRSGGYYVVGTRIGLDLVIGAYRRGESPEAILELYPSLGSVARVHELIAFIDEHPGPIDAYMKDQERLWEEFKRENPIPPDMLERFYRAAKDLQSKR